MNNTEERIKLIEAAIAERVEDYGDYELARIDSDDAYWLISVIRDLQKQLEDYGEYAGQLQYEKHQLHSILNKIRELTEKKV